MGAAAPAAVAEPAPEARPESEGPDLQQDPAPKQSSELGRLRNTVLNALANAGHRMLTSMLENGEWKVEGSELVITVAGSATVIDMSLGADAKRLAIATASGVLGRPVKIKVIPSGTPEPMTSPSRTGSNGSSRSRAEQDEVVRRMQEKFGAEIRTIIDYREKR